jgi:hypothetical protein
MMDTSCQVFKAVHQTRCGAVKKFGVLKVYTLVSNSRQAGPLAPSLFNAREYGIFCHGSNNKNFRGQEKTLFVAKAGARNKAFKRFIPPASSISSRANVFVPTETIGAIPIWKKTRGR